MTDGDTAGDGNPDPISSYTSPAHVVLDRVQLGLAVTFPMLDASHVVAFCAGLVRQGVLAKRPARAAAMRGHLPLGPFRVELPLRGVAQVTGRIFLREAAGGHLAITGQSTLLPNLMRALRSQIVNPGARATDGDDNLVPPCDDGDGYLHYLGLQLADAAAVVDALVASLAAAAGTEPGSLRGNVWVQQCEITRDYWVAGAEDFVRDFSERSIPGAGRERTRSVRDRNRNHIAVSWHEGAGSSAERKVYAKRHDLVRTEISLRNRKAVAALLQRTGMGRAGLQDLSGAAVASALADVARAAAPLLDALRLFANEVEEVPPRAGLDFVLALAGLTRLAVPPPRARGVAGRPADPSVADLARQALDRLIVEGVFDARGLGASDAVLMALKDMVGAGAVRASPARPRLFAIDPSLEVARQALAGVRQWPEVADGTADDEAGYGT